MRVGRAREALRAAFTTMEAARKEVIILPGRRGIEGALLPVWHRDRWISPALNAFMNLQYSLSGH